MAFKFDIAEHDTAIFVSLPAFLSETDSTVVWVDAQIDFRRARISQCDREIQPLLRSKSVALFKVVLPDELHDVHLLFLNEDVRFITGVGGEDQEQRQSAN